MSNGTFLPNSFFDIFYDLVISMRILFKKFEVELVAKLSTENSKNLFKFIWHISSLFLKIKSNGVQKDLVFILDDIESYLVSSKVFIF